MFLIWRFGEISKDRQIKNSPVSIIVCAPMVLRIQIAKLKTHQYLLRANSPNSMLAIQYIKLESIAIAGTRVILCLALSLFSKF